MYPLWINWHFIKFSQIMEFVWNDPVKYLPIHAILFLLTVRNTQMPQHQLVWCFRCEYGRVCSADLSSPARQNRTADHWHAHQEDYEPWWANKISGVKQILRQFIWEVVKYWFADQDPTSLRERLTRNSMPFSVLRSRIHPVVECHIAGYEQFDIIICITL
jgi:hypothetical protein